MAIPSINAANAGKNIAAAVVAVILAIFAPNVIVRRRRMELLNIEKVRRVSNDRLNQFHTTWGSARDGDFCGLAFG